MNNRNLHPNEMKTDRDLLLTAVVRFVGLDAVAAMLLVPGAPWYSWTAQSSWFGPAMWGLVVISSAAMVYSINCVNEINRDAGERWTLRQWLRTLGRTADPAIEPLSGVFAFCVAAGVGSLFTGYGDYAYPLLGTAATSFLLFLLIAVCKHLPAPNSH